MMRRLIFFVPFVLFGCSNGAEIQILESNFVKRLDSNRKPIYWVGLKWRNNGTKPVTKISGIYFVKDDKGTLLEQIDYLLYEGRPVSPGESVIDEYDSKTGADGYLIGFPGVYEETVGGVPSKVEAVVTEIQ